MITTILRTAIRSTLIQKGSKTSSELVKQLGLDPKRHKGTIHALMVDLEREGVLSATMKGKRRHKWSIRTTAIRKRDPLAAALIG
jgi:predicted transcriptional regulator